MSYVIAFLSFMLFTFVLIVLCFMGGRGLSKSSAIAFWVNKYQTQFKYEQYASQPLFFLIFYLLASVISGADVSDRRKFKPSLASTYHVSSIISKILFPFQLLK